MPHIGIDISRTLGQPTGVGWYARQLVRALSEVDSENQYTLYPFFWFCHPQDYKKARAPSKPNFRLHHANRSFEELQDRWTEGRYPVDKVLGPINLLHSPAYTAPYVPGKKLVVTIHDMSFLTHPHFHTEENRSFCMIQSLRASRYADAIICVSEATAFDVRRYLHVPKERLFVVREAAGPEYRRLDDAREIGERLLHLGIHENFILFVGTVEPRKNLTTLIEAYAEMKAESEHPEWLVIAGGSGWKNEQIYERVDELGIADAVKFLGYICTDDLVVLYNACRAFVYPSLYEGFGLPVLEAMACGAPVITSNCSSLPEVAGEAALLVDPENTGMLRQAMKSVLSDSSLRAELRRKGQLRADRYSWRETARQTRGIYQRCLE